MLTYLAMSQKLPTFATDKTKERKRIWKTESKDL